MDSGVPKLPNLIWTVDVVVVQPWVPGFGSLNAGEALIGAVFSLEGTVWGAIGAWGS
jgi:hypothetical protein